MYWTNTDIGCIRQFSDGKKIFEQQF